MNRITTLASIVLALVATAASAPAVLLPVDLAYGITADVNGGGPVSAITDGAIGTQYDSSNAAADSYVAIKFGAVKSFSRIILNETPGYVTAGKVIQIANVANPNAAAPLISSDWTTVQSYSGIASNGQNYYDLNGSYNASGVRILTTDKSNPGTFNQMRIHEVMVWDQNLSGNLATSASGYVGYGTASMGDNVFDSQTYNGGPDRPNVAGYTWTTTKTFSAVEIIGGSLGTSELITDMKLQYSVDGSTNWTDIPGASITGNTATILNFNFDTVSGKGLRAYVTTSAGDLGRITEFMVFTPEPSSLTLVAVGGLVALRRRRAA